jgi:cytochrome b pre-mRNA-processing protein 3
VPDSFDGRFDLLLVHIFLVVNRLKSEAQKGLDFNQALFDAMFADMDQTLREGGIGDMGVPKRMRKMMKAFNGRMHAYDEALRQGEGVLAIALRRNLYGTLEDENVPDVRVMVNYVVEGVEKLKGISAQEIMAGNVVFPEN